MDPRVASVRAPSGFASGKSPDLPESSLLWSSLRSELPGCPSSSLRWLHRLTQSPGCPKSPVFQRCRLTSFRVTPNLGLSAARLCFLRLPRFSIYGWVDDESPAVFELCILWLAPRMNLRFQRVQLFLPGSPCSLYLSPLFTLACASSESLQSTDPALPAKPRTAVQFPTGPSTERDIRPPQSVEASANLGFFCGYHHS